MTYYIWIGLALNLLGGLMVFAYDRLLRKHRPLDPKEVAEWKAEVEKTFQQYQMQEMAARVVAAGKDGDQ